MAWRILIILVFLGLAKFGEPVDAVLVGFKAQLIHDLFDDYDKKVYPAEFNFQAVNISLGLALNSIEDLDEKRQVLTIRTVLYQSWFDYQLRWDPHQYGNTRVLSVKAKRLWMPDIFLYNNAQGHYGEGRLRTSLIVHHTGQVISDYPAILKSSCEIAVLKYPFDTQTCVLKFGSWSYPQGKINLLMKDAEIDMKDYVSNGEWEVTGAEAHKGSRKSGCCGPLYDDIQFTLHLKRLSLYHAMYYVIPCVIIGLMTTLIFWLPTNINERMTVGLTLLIALSFFFLMVADNLPAVSDEIPIVAMYYVVTTTLSACAYFLTCAVLRCHFHNPLDGGMPKWMEVYVFNYLAKFVFLYEPPGYSMQDHINADKELLAKEAPIESFNIKHQKEAQEEEDASDNDSVNEAEMEKQREEQHANRVIMDSVKQKLVLDWRQSQWERVADIFNRFFSILYTIGFSIATLVFLYHAFNG